MRKAVVDLFNFSLGIRIDIDNESYNIVRGNAKSILEMIHCYNIDEIVLVGPKIITSKYEKDLKEMDMTDFNNKKYIVTTVEG